MRPTSVNPTTISDFHIKIGLIITLTLASLCHVSALHCYHCEPSSPSCQDPIEKSEVDVRECGNTFSVGPALIRRAYHIHNNESEKAVLKRNMVRDEEVEDHDLNQHKYVCVKIQLEGHDLDRSAVSGTIRGCFIDKQDVCHLIGSVVTDVTTNLVRATSCSICRTDYCNAANATNAIPIIFLISSVILTIYNWKFRL